MSSDESSLSNENINNSKVTNIKIGSLPKIQWKNNSHKNTNQDGQQLNPMNPEEIANGANWNITSIQNKSSHQLQNNEVKSDPNKVNDPQGKTWKGEEDNEEIAKRQLHERVRNTKFYSYTLLESRWKPEARESHAATVINNCLYLYGGCGTDLYQSMCQITPESWKWKKMEQGGDSPTEGRQGHSVCTYKSYVVLFGGERKFNKSMKMRECFNDCRLYSPLADKWMQIKLFGDPIDNRRNHIAVVVSKHMIIQAGIDSNGKYLNDIQSINLETYKITKIVLKQPGEGIAFHAGCAVFKSDIKIDSLTAPFEKGHKGKGTQILHQGIYTFGGRKENGEAVGKLRILHFGKNPVKWIEPNCKGQPPLPRFQHTLNFVRDQNFLVLVGGRSELADSHSLSNVLGDTFIFSLSFFEWIKVEVKGRGSPQRCSHTSSIIDTKLVIFGGIENEGFCNSDLIFIELDQNKSFLFQKEHQKRLVGPRDVSNTEINNILQHQFTVDIITMENNLLFHVPFSGSITVQFKNVPHGIEAKEKLFEVKGSERNIIGEQQKSPPLNPKSTTLIQNGQNDKEPSNNSNINPKFTFKTFLPLPYQPKRSGYIKDLALGELSDKQTELQMLSKRMIENLKKTISYSDLISMEED